MTNNKIGQLIDKYQKLIDVALGKNSKGYIKECTKQKVQIYLQIIKELRNIETDL